MIGESAPMQALQAYIGKVAVTDSHVLITGETGTGKELAAQQIHQHSPRWQQPFICVNCPAIPDSLFESELFGYERGAFTGAVTRNQGAFERADGGTLFLDEIGEMHSYAQAKILRAVEEKAVHRLGGQQRIPLNIRIIAATNQDLERLVAAGQFRPDLYFRLNVASIHLPPLRERTLDLWPLCEHYIQALNRQSEREIEGFTADVFAALLRYAWPGNVRELKNLIEAIFITAASGVITFMDLPEPFRRRLGDAAGLPVNEREQLLAALVSTQWNKSQAAQQLHWSRMTVYRKLRQYHLTVPRERPPPRPSTHGRGQKKADVPLSTRMPPGTAMATGAPPHLPSWELPEALWQRMAAVIPPRKSQAGHPRTVDLRRITEGIFYVLRTGTPWHACPRVRFGPPSTVYYYFVQWVNAGVFAALWAEALTM
jgi:two-component system response regulator HydG/two-component system response regulator AtoC